MKSKQRVELNKDEWFNHFGVSIYLLLPVFIFGYLWFKNSDNSYLYLIFVFPIISTFSFWLNWKRLLFQKFKANLTDEQFIRTVSITAKELHWQVEELEGSYAKAFRFSLENEIGGEKILIKKIGNKLLINSMANPEISGNGNGYSQKKNRENVKSFLINAKYILEGKDAEKAMTERQKKKEEAFWKASEWTFIKTIKRILGYGLVLVFILISIIFIYEEMAWEALTSSTFALIAGFNYVKNDILILREKKRRKNAK